MFKSSVITKKLLLSTSALIAAGAAFMPATAKAVDDYADWDGVTITHGNATVTNTGLGTTSIEQHGLRAIGEAQQLHIGVLGDVTIHQDSSNSLFVGRVIGDHDDPTQILGKLSANGRVMIIDRNGVLFGTGSRVDAAGIAVTTGDVADDQIMSGSDQLTFQNFGKGEIVIDGQINVADAGLAAFVSPTIKNNGVITAKMGHVVMAAGEKVTLDMYGDGLVEVAVEGDLAHALIENKGRIDAEGGTVQLTAKVAKGVVDTVVNNEGIINASSATVKGGKIILSGGDNGAVNVAGLVDASGTQGGQISVTGRTVNITKNGKLKNLGHGGNTYVYGKEKTTFKGTLASGKNSTNEISGHELELGGAIELGEGSSISFDPAILHVGAAEAATFVSALNNNGVTVNVSASDKIIVDSDINSSAQLTNSILHFLDQDANNLLQVDLNAKILLGANQTLTGDATLVNVSSAGKIQNGVDVSKNGATVNVAAGTYNESVKINKALTLRGANAGIVGNGVRGAESIVVPGAGSPGFYVTASDVTVDGFDISGGNVGIQVMNADRAILKNNSIHGQFDASAEGDSFGGLATGDGIYVENAFNTNILNNFITNYNDDGIQLRRVQNATVSGNVIQDNGNGDEGIAVAIAEGDINITNNTVKSARRDGIQVTDAKAHINILGNTIQGSKNIGVSLVHVVGLPTVVDDNIIRGGKVGVDIVDSDNVLVGDDNASPNSGNSITDVTTGIQVSNTDRLTIQDNNIISKSDGIRFINGISGNKRIFVYDNDINAKNVGILVQGGISNGSIVNLGAQNIGNTIVATSDGIRVEGSVTGSRLRITGSNITGGNDGIEIGNIGEDGVVAVWYNDSIKGLGANGIRVGSITPVTSGSGFSVVGNGLIDGSVQDGIVIGNVSNANVGIVDNDVINGHRHGINFIGTLTNANVLIGDDGLDVTDSVINTTTGDGIHFDKLVDNSHITIGAGSISTHSTASTTDYTIAAKGGVVIHSGNDGIGADSAFNNSKLIFAGNKITSGDNGHEFLGTLTNTDVTITGNIVNAANDAIDFDNNINGGHIIVGSALGYAGNNMTSGQSGVEFGKQVVGQTANVVIDILNNTINAGVHGVSVDYGIVNNVIATITGNDIKGAERGISVAGGDLTGNTSFYISNNTRIEGTTRDGIIIQDLISGGAAVHITNNTNISGGDDAIDLRNIVSGTIGSNIIHNSVNNGVQLVDSSNIGVFSNTIQNNTTGLYLVGSKDIDIQNNTLAQNILYGLHADGTGNGALTLKGNVFLDNPVGARFESGQIDVSDVTNPNTFKVSSGYNPGVTPLVGMQFDGAPTLLTITGETLGKTIFEGYGLRPAGSAYYVRFENGSILNTATLAPIVINGDFASWDGLVPNTFAGFLTSVEHQNIEDRLFDADDAVVNGRGQIFVSVIPPVTPPDRPPVPTTGNLSDIQDIFRDFQTPDERVNRASLRVLGLPPINLASLNGRGFNPASLNALVPQAGEGAAAVAAVEPAAGGEAAVEPAAGGGAQDQQVTCWGDAINSLQNNGTVTYNFGGTFEDGIDAQAACATAQQI